MQVKDVVVIRHPIHYYAIRRINEAVLRRAASVEKCKKNGIHVKRKTNYSYPNKLRGE